MEFVHIPEPYSIELVNYVRQRRDHILVFSNLQEVKSELLRNVTDHVQPVDSYPKGRQYLNDDEYLSILKDMFNLSHALDDMEQTGWIPCNARGHYYNIYSRLYRKLVAKTKNIAA